MADYTVHITLDDQSDEDWLDYEGDDIESVAHKCWERLHGSAWVEAVISSADLQETRTVYLDQPWPQALQPVS